MKDPWADSPTEGWMIEVITKDQNKTKDKETAMDNLFMAVFGDPHSFGVATGRAWIHYRLTLTQRQVV